MPPINTTMRACRSRHLRANRPIAEGAAPSAGLYRPEWTRRGIPRLLVAVGSLHALVPLLRLDRQRGDRPGLQPPYADRLIGLLAPAIGAGIDAAERGVNL